MASPVYSTRIFAALALEGSQTFTCPAGYRTVLRDVDLWMYNNADTDFFYVAGSEDQNIWAIVADAGVFGAYQWRGRQVFNPGELIIFSNAGGFVDVTASGYLLTLP